MKPEYTFENFFVHEGNKVAYTAAKKVAESPGEVFNPLYIHGAVDLGKTHLLSALSDALKKKCTVDFMSAAEFENALMDRQKFDVPLIVDDIHKMSDIHKKRLKSIVERALQDNIQLCFSSEVPPRAVNGFSSKLCSLIESGMVCELTAPDKGVRVHMVRKKADDAGIILADDTIEELARIATGSFGTIDSMIRRLVSYSSLGNLAIDANSIRLILKDFFPGAQPLVVSSLLEQTRSQDIWSLADVDEPGVNQEYEKRLGIWEMKGYDVSYLKASYPGDALKLRRAYHDYVDRVRDLVELQQVYSKVDRERSPAQALQIESMLFNPFKVNEIRRLLAAFGEDARTVKGFRKFNEFIVGFCNKLVWDAYHDNILENPGVQNPFIVFGRKGTGKSHFLEAACDDLTSRNKAVLLYDLALTADIDPVTAADRHDILVLDNFDATFNASESVISDVGGLVDAFRKKNRQVLIASNPVIEDTPVPAALRSILEAGVASVLERPSADVVAQYIKRHIGSDLPPGIEPVFPEFESFYEIDYYIQGLGEDGQAVIPLGLPGEEPHIQPAAASRPVPAVGHEAEAAAAGVPREICAESLVLTEVTEELIDEKF
ncbi:hypothetical protein IBX73_02510 [candidate division WOR-3 bacterium]|nr:hypothetical protein [candidate division WOR-3 bacterium]